MDKVNSVQELIERTQGMPLERMRFFINEDRREPKCFGIYYDMPSERWIVYKNKADGSRAVRYSGPDEAYAANELWMKIRSEINNRQTRKAENPKADPVESILLIAIVILAIALAVMLIVDVIRSPNRGYYRNDSDLYYYQDDAWYWYDDGDWVYYDAPDDSWYDDYEYDDDYPYDDFSNRFENSDYYVAPSQDDDDWDSDIFDDWDSDDTDWDSDW